MSRCLRIAVATCAIACGMAAPAHAYVYWTTVGAGFSSDGTTLGRADQDGSAANHALINTASGPAGVTVDGSHIYWANSQTNSIGRANLDGSSPSPQFIPHATTASAGPTNVAVDSAHVYWTDGTRYIGRAKLDGTSPQPHFIDAGLNSYPYALGVAQGA